MNSSPTIFNKDILEKYLNSFQIEAIADYSQKHSVMLRWKQSIDEKRFHKTKETAIQGRFLSSVFEDVLGYKAVDNASEWNQQAEYKSVLDSTQADCALGFFTADAKTSKIVRAVIELKDANTSLDSKQQRSNHLTPVEQAFQYAHKNGSGCGWVIVSNFVEIRLYKAASSLEYEQFFITDLEDEAKFKRFYFLLCKDNLIAKEGKSLVDKLYNENELARDEISRQFYNDYKNLRSGLFDALKKHNLQSDPLILFSMAQKLLDRFIFVCFCENRMLLPQGIVKNVVAAAKSSYELTEYRLWREFKGLFHSIDKGNPAMNINGYNGGLFRRDEILDNLVIPDDALESFGKLAEYDFGSDLNVNILGHIFEQSISDLEIVKAGIEGKEVDRGSGKQKADGIYYTPDYVTRFIVEKTIGRYLSDKKNEIRKEFGKNVNKLTKKQQILFWEKYADCLKSIKILDPACGSGAFLNCAFDYLVEEGRSTAEMQNSLLDGQISLFDWNTHILQNNLYGVDLNGESVEITKLSLWLKTADKTKPLAYIDDNIKAGNSIIADPEIAGDKAFDWVREFPDIMAQGGFDVVLGNPPYGARLKRREKDYLIANYETTEGNFDTYKTFIEFGLKLTKRDGYMGYITPNTFFVLEKGANKLRKFLFENYTLLDIVELFNVFPTAVVEPTITIFKNTVPEGNETLKAVSVPRKTDFDAPFTIDGIKTLFVQRELRERVGYIFNYRATEQEKKLRQKIDSLAKPLSEYFIVSNGMKPYETGKGTPPQTKETGKNKLFEGYMKVDDSWLPYVRGETFHRYTDRWDGQYIKYGEWLAAPRNPEIFKNEKLFVRQTGDYPIVNYDSTGKICKNSVHLVNSFRENSDVSLKYVLGLLNSRLMKWIYQYDNFQEVGKVLAEVKKAHVERLPIVIADNQQPVVSLVDALLEICQKRFNKSKEFIEYIKAIYNPKKVSEKLFSFYNLDFAGFISELKRQKVKLSPKQEMELMPLFNEKAQELSDISKRIEDLDRQMDELVFKLYRITDKERDMI